jgi:hypothetical protein
MFCSEALKTRIYLDLFKTARLFPISIFLDIYIKSTRRGFDIPQSFWSTAHVLVLLFPTPRQAFWCLEGGFNARSLQYRPNYPSKRIMSPKLHIRAGFLDALWFNDINISRPAQIRASVHSHTWPQDERSPAFVQKMTTKHFDIWRASNSSKISLIFEYFYTLRHLSLLRKIQVFDNWNSPHTP